ncbi:MAG: hypothetical protein HOP28_02150, partial [Gemmatimonadales bacterium]|nr:hypothetical protein [Gemmatimonadales bacterium]
LAFNGAGLTQQTSSTIALTAGAATQLGVTTQPSATAQNAIAFPQQPAIQLQDLSGNAVSTAGVNITAAIASGGGTLNGTAIVATNGSGVAAFAGLSITGTIGVRTLTFTSGSLTAATSGNTTLTAGTATKLAITTQPSASAGSGAAFAQQPVVQLQDVSNNAVTGPSVNVTAAIAGGGGTLGGTAVIATNGSGAAVFTNLSITGTIGDRTLTFTSGALTAATSGTITITPGAATQITMTTQPSATAQNGAVLAQQPAVQLRDDGGNAVSQAGVNVTAAIASGGGTLGGTAIVATNASGVATFAGLTITGTIGNRTLSFSSGILTPATSTAIGITAGAATKLAITTAPSASVSSGVAFAQQPVIQLQDQSNNAVSQLGVTITAAIATGTGTLGGTLTANTNAAGAASFTDLMLTGASGNFTLTFTSGALTAANSGTITLGAGSATKLTITTQPSATAASGAAFAQQPVIQLRDGSDNPVAQAGVNVTVAIATGGGTLGGTATVATNASGVATFAGLSIAGIVGDRTLTFTSGALTAATSTAISITVGAQAALTITTQPSAAPVNDVAFAQQPVIQLRDGGGNAVLTAGVTVTAAIASGAVTLGGTLTANTDANGVATFTNLKITGAVGNRTLTFTSGGLTAPTSGTIGVTHGAATNITITTQPSASAANDAAFPQQPAIQLRDISGNPVLTAGVTVTAALASGGITLGGTLTANTDANGLATFTNLKITGTIGDRTISFTTGAFTPVVSGTVTITAGAATQLSITTMPTTGTTGVALTPAPVIQLRDISGNIVNQAGVSINVIIQTGTGTIGGTTAVATAADGTATFSNVTITGTGAFTLRFTSGGLTQVDTGTITIS